MSEQQQQRKERYQGEERRSGWHLDKSVSITHIFTTVSVIAALFVGWAHMDTRVAILEAEAVHAKEADGRLEVQLRESVVRIEAAVVRIETALKDKADK